jgi:hypothetical protein
MKPMQIRPGSLMPRGFVLTHQHGRWQAGKKQPRTTAIDSEPIAVCSDDKSNSSKGKIPAKNRDLDGYTNGDMSAVRAVWSEAFHKDVNLR